MNAYICSADFYMTPNKNHIHIYFNSIKEKNKERKVKEIVRRLSHMRGRTEDGRRAWCDTNAPLSHRSRVLARLRTGNAWNGVRAIVHKIRISSARDDPPATIPTPSNIRGRMDINLPIYYRCIDIPGRRFEISTRSSRFVAQRVTILAALMSLRFACTPFLECSIYCTEHNSSHSSQSIDWLETVNYLGRKKMYDISNQPFSFSKKRISFPFTKNADNAIWL